MQESTSPISQPNLENPVPSPVPTPVPVTTPVPLVKPLTPKPHIIFWKLLLGILIIIFISITAFIAYQNMQLQKQVSSLQKPAAASPLASPSGDPTAGWQTYTNTKVGFSIKYPADILKVREGTGNDHDIYIEQVVNNTTNGESGYVIWSAGYSNPDKLPVKQIITVGISPALASTINFDKSTLGIYTVYTTDGLPGQDVSHCKIFTLDETKYQSLCLTPYNPDLLNGQMGTPDERHQMQQSFDLFTQILSTFQFTSVSQAPTGALDPTANWKTYTDAKYGFSFKYPETQYTQTPPTTNCPAPADGSSATQCMVSLVKSCANYVCDPLLGVNIFLNPNDSNFTYQMNDMTGALSYSKIVDSSLGGLAAKLRVYSDPKPTFGQMYYIAGSKYSYVISGMPGDATSDQILSTFQFAQ